MQRESRLIACLVLVLGCVDVEGESVEDSCIAQLGESCSGRPCVEGAICYAEQELCIEGLQLGENCGGTIPCALGLACDGDARACVAAPEAGEPCNGFTCDEDAYCRPDPVDPANRTCAALGEPDAPCMGHPQCASGYCPAGFCKPLPEKGEPCFDKCAVGLACNGGGCVQTTVSSCD